jgi:hypothetical protein
MRRYLGYLDVHCMEERIEVSTQLAQILVTLSIFISTGALAQSGLTANKSLSLSIVGFYSFSADDAAYSRFVENQIALHNPANFSKETKEVLRRMGRNPVPFTNEDRDEWDENLRSHMDDAAVFEVEVTDSDASFDISKFVQPDPAQAERLWQVAWNEKFLTPDGETLIKLGRTQKLPVVSRYRVVFVIHFWKLNLPLHCGDRELALPAQQPLPERLWRLAPYQLPG